jgi:ATP-dependent DNA helicase RecQ
VIDVLRGADNEKVKQHRHHEVSTYAIGAEHSVNHWRSVLRQLMVRGAVFADVAGYGSLKLTADARAILRGEGQLHLREDLIEARAGRTRTRAPAIDIAAHEEPLWEALRNCRKRLAEEQGVPPYVIFHDRTLRDMLTQKPGSHDEMLSIVGVGQAKLERYGQEFLDVMAAAT